MKMTKVIATQDAGVDWVQIEGQLQYEVNTYCITSTGRIIAGTGDDNTVANAKGIWYSDDNGKTWTQSNVISGNWSSLCVTSTGRIIASTSTWKVNDIIGLWYSDNDGETWVQLNNSCCACLWVTPTGRIIGGGWSAIVFYSDDNGVSWSTFSYKKIPKQVVTCLCALPSGRIVAGSNDGIWYSDDDGETWTQSNKTDGDWSSLCVTSTGRVLAGGGSSAIKYGVWYSDDNGINWVQSNRSDRAWYSFCVTPTGRIIAGSNDGIWYSDDNGVNWIKSNKTSRAWYYLYTTLTGRIIAGSSKWGIWYSDSVSDKQIWYTSKLLTGEQAKELVRQCKAYVQAKKAEQQNNG